MSRCRLTSSTNIKRLCQNRIKIMFRQVLSKKRGRRAPYFPMIDSLSKALKSQLRKIHLKSKERITWVNCLKMKEIKAEKKLDIILIKITSNNCLQSLSKPIRLRRPQHRSRIPSCPISKVQLLSNQSIMKPWMMRLMLACSMKTHSMWKLIAWQLFKRS